MTESATPNDMPGGSPAFIEPTPVDTAETLTSPPKGQDPKGLDPEKLDPEKLLEWNKKLQKENETRRLKLKELEDARLSDSTRFTEELLKALGVDKKPPSDFDPVDEIKRLRADFESASIERLRSDVARTTGVDPEDIKGSTEEQMRASAESYLERFNTRLEAALKAKAVPAAPPASTVTSDGKISGPEQITSQDELKRMSPQEIQTARKEGRLDRLMGKTST